MRRLPFYVLAGFALLILIKTGCNDLENITAPDISPMIKAVIPARAPYGARIIIGGTGFGSDKNEVELFFNKSKAVINALNDSTILTRVPKDATTGSIKVVTNGDTLTGPLFTVDATKSLWLEITDINPKEGRTGDSISISGNGFKSTAEHNKVYFGGIMAKVNNALDTLLTVTVPPKAQSGPVMMVVDQDTAIGPVFTIINPLILDVAPLAGPVGKEVVITGNGFSSTPSENTVSFNGTETEPLKASKTKLVVRVPEGATTGPVIVTANDYVIEGPKFTVQEPKKLMVSVMTEGTEKDPDGYVFSVEGRKDEAVLIYDERVYNEIYGSEVQITLTGMAPNCRVEGANPRTVRLSTKDMAETTFNVDCTYDLRGKMVFTSSVDYISDIYIQSYVLDREKPGFKQITTTPGISEATPAISPDGLQIAFTADTKTDRHIFIMDSDGSDIRQLTKSGFTTISWSPKGDKLVFQSRIGNAYEAADIFTINVDGTNRKNITNTSMISEQSPDWSEQGIIYSSNKAGKDRIYLIQADGTGETPITGIGANDDDPEWSPDGSSIVFVRNTPDRGVKVHLMDKDGSNIRELISYSGFAYEGSPTWSPNGENIAFNRLSGGTNRIIIFNIEGNDVMYAPWPSGSENQSPHWNY